MSDYRIGISQETLTALDELETPVVVPAATPPEYPDSVTLGNGGERAIGTPVISWEFGVLDVDQRAQLKTFCAGKYAEIFISSDLADGSFADFSVTLIWPNEKPTEIGSKLNMVFEFRNVVQLEPLGGS